MSIIEAIFCTMFLIVLLIVMVISWYILAPKLSTGRPIYYGVAPATITVFLMGLIKGVYTGTVIQKLQPVLWTYGIFLLIWIIAVAIQYCRPIERVFASYRSFYEHSFQDSARFTKAFPFPTVKSRLTGIEIACILNPLAWYEYLIWWIVFGTEKVESDIDSPRPNVMLLKPLGEGTVVTPELIVRDYPGIIGKQLGTLYAGDNIFVYETSVVGWYGYIVGEAIDYWPESVPENRDKTSVRYVSSDYIHLAEP